MRDYLEIARRVMRERGGSQEPEPTEPLESVLKGKAIELYQANGDRLFIVADEDDARLLSELRGTIYTATEVRWVVSIADPSTVAEIHRWKRAFNATVSEVVRHSPNAGGASFKQPNENG